MPTHCPLCGVEVVKPEGEVKHRCPNRACPSRGLETLIHWVTAAMDIDGVGEQFVRKLWDEGLLRSMPDLYRLTPEQLLEVEGYGEISATRAVESIERSKQQPFSRVLFGLNMPKVGWVLARNLARHFGNVDALMAATQEELEEAEGFGPDRAELIAEWFADEENRALVRDLRELGLQFEVGEADRPVEGRLTGSQYVITGTLEGYSRDQAKAALEALGAKVSDSVSKKTTGVIVGENPGSKAAKAEKAGVPILGEAELEALLAGEPLGRRRRQRPGVAPARIVTNLSWAERAAHDETGFPFSSTANTTSLRMTPESVQARLVVPVLPFTCPRSAGRRRLSVPLTPATASEPTNAALIAGSVAPACDDADERGGGEAIEAREPGAIDDADAVDRDSGLPHRRDHEPPAARRRSDLAVGGGKLLEQHLGVEVVALVIHVADDRGEGVGDVRRRASSQSAGATPRPGRPTTVTPRRVSASRNARAASSGGERAGQPRARSTTRAESGGVSPPMK